MLMAMFTNIDDASSHETDIGTAISALRRVRCFKIENMNNTRMHV